MGDRWGAPRSPAAPATNTIQLEPVMSFLNLGHRIEYEWLGPDPAEAPTIVLLHHGLGSVSAWREFPRALADATGLGVVAYSRVGHGASSAAAGYPRPVDFMHHEARHELPRILEALYVRWPILVGHSDGASIALIYAGSEVHPRPLGLVALAPHVFVEPCTLTAARAARDDFRTGNLRTRLARRHDDPDGVFWGWNTTWLQPGFARWNIEAVVRQVQCPMLVVQGLEDEYGTLEQVARIRAAAPHAPQELVLAECGHAPHRDRPDETLRAIVRHVRDVLSTPARDEKPDQAG